MTRSLNLLAHYDKTLAEINRELAESIIKEVIVVKKKGNKAVTVALFASLVVISTFAYIFFSYFVNISGQSINTGASLPNDSMLSSEEKLGYVSVQIFEFADETAILSEDKSLTVAINDKSVVSEAEPIVRDNVYTDKEKSLGAISAIPTTITEPPKVAVAPAKPAPVKKPAPVAVKPPVVAQVADKQYYLLFEGLNSNEYENIKKINLNFNLSNNIIDIAGVVNVVWRVYEITPDGDIVLNDNKVKYVNEFNDKEDAINFAKTNSIQSVIRSEELDNRIYTVKLSHTTLDDAKKFAVATDIKDKVIKIVRAK